MFVDSHCHIDFPEFTGKLDQILQNMTEKKVTHALCVCVTLENFERVLQVASYDDRLRASVGVHPDYQDIEEPDVDTLVKYAMHSKVVAIGETGLDYFRCPVGDVAHLEWQRERFRIHIRAARKARKPLIIHTRSAAADTLKIMQEENAAEIRGVMHCFTEDWSIAQKALDMGFYISISGIVTFKNAETVRDVARKVPAERLLIETDSPYLAPVPFRGKLNEPSWVKYVAECLANVRSQSVEEIGELTTRNYHELFLTS